MAKHYSTVKASSVLNHKVTKLVGYKNFIRNNPKSDLFHIQKFHHVEFWCSDATNAYKRFQTGLGMSLVGKSDNTTGNTDFASYVLKSNDLIFTFTAPYHNIRRPLNYTGKTPGEIINYNQEKAFDFIKQHGFGIRAVGLVVDDATRAFHISSENGAIPVLPPTNIGDQVISEVKLYGDVVLRYISGNLENHYLSNYEDIDSPKLCYGLERLDHVVGNVPKLLDTANYIINFTGFHEFAEFTAEDIGTNYSGLNSMVLANNNEYVLLPVNEPVFGTIRQSQIQTFLDQNNGPGVQHLALKTNDIITTLSQMRRMSDRGGFDFMPRPSNEYYKKTKSKFGMSLTSEQYDAIEELGILVDKDDQGVIMQIFTKPVSDRATMFLEIIQRIGCEIESNDNIDGIAQGMTQAGGCGGFGKGNFSELFKSVEDYERTLTI